MRHTINNVLLLGFCGCMIHLGGCGGSSEPTVASTDPTTAAPAPSPSPADTQPANSTDETSNEGEEPSGGSGGQSGGYEAPSGYGSESGGYEDPSGYGGESGGYQGASGYGGESSGYEDPSGYGSSSYGDGTTGYGYGAQGYGGGRSGGNSLWERMTAGVAGFVTPAVSQFSAPGGASQGPPKSFFDRAAEAFEAGNEPLARKLYLTHMVAEFEDADQAFSETQFSNILKRPAWAIQWGVSVHVRFSGDGDQKIHPVTEDMSSPLGKAVARGGMRRGNPGGGYEDAGGGYGEAGGGYGATGSGMEQEYGYGPGSNGSMQPGGPGRGRNPGSSGPPAASTVDLREQLGLVADVTSEMIGQRFDSGAYGSAFAAYQRQSKSIAAAATGPANAAGRPQPGINYAEMSSATGEYGAAPSGASGQYGPQAGIPPYGMESEGGGYGMQSGSSDYEMQQGGGQYGGQAEGRGYAMEGQEGYGMQPQNGGYGMQPQNGGYGMQGGGYGMQPGPGMGPGNRPGRGTAVPPQTNVPAPELPRWRPGVVFVGKMNSTEALAKAQEHSLDFLIHFEVAVRTSAQTESTKNITRIRIYPATASKPLVTSKQIDNFEIYKIAEADRKTERECVEEVVGSLFEILDEKMVMRPMPTLKGEVAQNRVITLVETANQDLLRSLAEIRLYQWQQALDQEDVATAFHMAAGDDGLTILHGLPEAKTEILESYLDTSP